MAATAFTLDATATTLVNTGGTNIGPDGVCFQFTVTGTNSVVLKKNTAPPGAAASYTNVAYVDGSLVAQAAGTAITATGIAYVSAADAALDLYATNTWTSGAAVLHVSAANIGGSGSSGGPVPAADVTAGVLGANTGETGTYSTPGAFAVATSITSNGSSDAFSQGSTTASVVAGAGTNSGASQFIVRGAAAQVRAYTWRTGAASSGNRFQATVTGAESGANAGGDWTLNALDDTGVAIDTPMTVVRASGGAIYTAAGRSVTFGGAPAAAATVTRNRKATTAIANNTATTVATITVPNAAHSVAIVFTVVGSLGAGGAIGANEASASNSYVVTIARTAGVNAVGAISSAYGAAASAVAGAATVTSALTLAAVAGAVGATNTIDVQVTIVRSGGSSTNHTALVKWEILNANAAGVTVA